MAMHYPKDPKKKEAEQPFFEELRRSVADFPAGKIEGDAESPDFRVLLADGSVLGIELTELVDLASIQKVIAFQRIVRLAQQKAVDRQLPAVGADVHFEDNGEFSSDEYETIADQIVDIVEQAEVPTGVDRPCKLACPTSSPVKSIIVRKSHEHAWESEPTGLVHESFVAELQKAIDKKNGLLQAYLENCSRCWLLIYTDGNRGSESSFELSAAMKQHVYASNFERVYFIGGNPRTVTRLNVRKSVE